VTLAASQPSPAQDADRRGPDSAKPNLTATSPPTFDEPPSLKLESSSSRARSNLIELEPRPPAGHWAAYAHAMTDTLNKALRANAKLYDAQFHVRCELWIDSRGHVVRVELVEPSGDAKLDAILRNEIFVKITLPVPPTDMPMPVKEEIVKRPHQH
jgi:hypothetical protein